MKKRNAVQMIGAMLLLLAISACGSAGTNSTSDASSTTSATDSALPEPSVSATISKLFDSVCGSRPTPAKKGEDLFDTKSPYDEVLAEKDMGGELADATKALLTNLAGIVYTESATDGKLTWALRKWALAENKEKADAAFANIKASYQTSSGTAQVSVSHPGSSFPGTRYQTCLVAYVPAGWETAIKNESGLIGSLNHEAGLAITNESGQVEVTKKGTGLLTINNRSGNITVQADSTAGVNVTNVSGNIGYNVVGSSSLQTASLLKTESGNVNLIFGQGVGLKLDAKTDVGNIIATNLPEPTVYNITGKQLTADINGGGATLTVQAGAGNIKVE